MLENVALMKHQPYSFGWQTWNKGKMPYSCFYFLHFCIFRSINRRKWPDKKVVEQKKYNLRNAQKCEMQRVWRRTLWGNEFGKSNNVMQNNDGEKDKIEGKINLSIVDWRFQINGGLRPKNNLNTRMWILKLKYYLTRRQWRNASVGLMNEQNLAWVKVLTTEFWTSLCLRREENRRQAKSMLM